MKEIQNLKEHILKEYPRMGLQSSFCFKCHKDVPCFNACCGDVNIFLTPYDIIRLKQNLGISSTELLKKHTISPFDKNLKYPVIMLQMNDDENKTCPFVSDQGCTVYDDRPWACRMYPLGLAQPGDGSEDLDEEFFFLLKEANCEGFKEDREITVEGWIKDQGIEEYTAASEEFKDLTTHKFFQDGGDLGPKQMEMFFLAAYDVDRFRKFVFETSFLDKFVIDDATVEKIKTDDMELLRLGFKWLRMALFNEKTLLIRPEVEQAVKDDMKRKAEQRAQAEARVNQKLYGQNPDDQKPN